MTRIASLLLLLLVVVLVVLVVLVLVLLVLVVLLVVLVVLVVLLLRVGSAVRGGAIAATRCSDVRPRVDADSKGQYR
jgi:hypothetical protein